MTSTDEERWLEAEQRIAPVSSPERRRAGRRSWLLLIGGSLGCGVIAAAVRALVPHRSTSASSGGSDLAPTLWIGLAIACAGLIVVLGGLVAGFLTRRLRPAWDRVDGALSRSQLRRVRLRIRGREAVDARHEAVVRAVAEQDVRTAVALIPCYVGTALMAAGLMLVLDLPASTAVLACVLVLLAGTAAWQYAVAVRAARRHLASG